MGANNVIEWILQPKSRTYEKRTKTEEKIYHNFFSRVAPFFYPTLSPILAHCFNRKSN